MPYIIAILAIVIIGVGFTLFQAKPQSEAPVVATATTEIEAPTTETETATVSDYKDGTYKTDVSYQTPMRAEYNLEVTLIVANDVVTDAQIVYSNGAEKDPNAQRFEAAYRTEVLGKDIDTLNLARVGGASLTTGAFNNALANIKADAKS